MWVAEAKKTLMELKSGPGWGYRKGSEPSVEPTVLACLALLATAAPDEQAAVDETSSAAGDWLAGIQRKSGALGVSGKLPRPNWPTSYGVLLWRLGSGHQEALERAVDWLLERRGETWDPPEGTPLGHDTRIAGWPWVDKTHSWVEPTSLAVIALRAEGRGDHERTREGLRMIADRAVPTGGWNYGNSLVFDTPLRPRPAPTGLALLACSGRVPGDEKVRAAISYLEKALPPVRSAQSLCWGLLGLRAWGRFPVDAQRWLAEAAPAVRRRSSPATELAYLLLASSPGTLALLGLTPHSRRESRP